MWVAKRYLLSSKDNNFISLISAISIFGITIAVSVLIIVLSVVNGFEKELREKLLSVSAHNNCKISNKDLAKLASIHGLSNEIGSREVLG